MTRRRPKFEVLPEDDRQALFDAVQAEGLQEVLDTIEISPGALASLIGGDPVPAATVALAQRFLDDFEELNEDDEESSDDDGSEEDSSQAPSDDEDDTSEEDDEPESEPAPKKKRGRGARSRA